MLDRGLWLLAYFVSFTVGRHDLPLAHVDQGEEGDQQKYRDNTRTPTTHVRIRRLQKQSGHHLRTVEAIRLVSTTPK